MTISSDTRPEPSLARRSKRSHEAVLAAAEALLAETGYSSATIDQIAVRAGVSKATIYRWWPNRAAIFMELYHVLGRRTIMPIDTGSIAGDLQKQVRGAFRLFRETVAGLALAGFVAEAQSSPDTARMLREDFAGQRRQINTTMLKRAMERGEISRDISVETVSDMVTGSVYYAVLMGQSGYSDSHADEIVRTVLHGIQGSAPPRAGGPPTARRVQRVRKLKLSLPSG